MDDEESTLIMAPRSPWSTSEPFWILVVFLVGLCLLASLVLLAVFSVPGQEDLKAPPVKSKEWIVAVPLDEVPPRLVLANVRPLTYSLTKESNCSSTVCRWNAEYLYQLGQRYDRPCEDFYEYVCGAIKWKWNRDKTLNLSYAQLSSRQLMLDFDLFFKRFLALKKKPTDGVNDNFLVQSIWLYETCRALPNSSLEEATLDAFSELLRTLQIRDWPYETFTGNVLTVVSTGDRLLMLQALFRVNVLSGNNEGRKPQILFGTPVTYLWRYASAHDNIKSTKQYKEIIDRALRTFRNCSFVSRSARQIFELEEALEKASDFQRSSAEFAVKQFTTVGALAKNQLWDWLRYLRLLFQTQEAITNSTVAFVDDPAFFSTFASVIGRQNSTAIANYVGFKAMVTLWPYMPSTFQFLGNLSIDANSAPVDKRLVACTAILEKMYRYGVGIAAKLTISREFANVYRRQRDNEFDALFLEIRAIVKQLLQSGASWFHRKDIQRALAKLDNMTLAFGTGHDFINYELYRKTPRYFVASRGIVLDAVVRVLSYASAVYWDAFVNNSKRPAAYDNAYTMSVFEWGSEYQPTNNHIFIPNAVAGYLSEISNSIPIQLYPAILQHFVRAMLRGIIRSNSLVADPMKPHEWWHKESVRSYKNQSECLWRQYDAAASSGDKEYLNTTTLSRLEDDFLDSAILWPLYKLYQDALQKHNVSDKCTITLRKRITANELFFYNYALTYCTGRDNASTAGKHSLAETPAKLRVNVPFINFPPFRQAFSCDKMKPGARYCEVWKTAQ